MSGQILSDAYKRRLGFRFTAIISAFFYCKKSSLTKALDYIATGWYKFWQRKKLISFNNACTVVTQASNDVLLITYPTHPLPLICTCFTSHNNLPMQPPALFTSHRILVMIMLLHVHDFIYQDLVKRVGINSYVSMWRGTYIHMHMRVHGCRCTYILMCTCNSLWHKCC